MVWLPLPWAQQLTNDAFVYAWHADCALKEGCLALWCALVINADAPPLVVQLVYRQLPHQAPAHNDPAANPHITATHTTMGAQLEEQNLA